MEKNLKKNYSLFLTKKNSFSPFFSNLIITIFFWLKKPSTNRKITIFLIILSFLASVITYLVFSNSLPYIKTTPTIAVITLVLITSAGIFGFLSNAYQGATVQFEKESTTLLFKEERLKQLQEDKVFLKEELDAGIADLPNNYRTARRKLREDYQPLILV